MLDRCNYNDFLSCADNINYRNPNFIKLNGISVFNGIKSGYGSTPA